jgi:phosphoglycerate dehydrogenase-like enzyme
MNSSDRAVVNVLLTDAMARAYGDRMRAIAGPLNTSVVFHPPGEQIRKSIEILDIAFFSRDVFADKDRQEADTATRTFFSIVEQAERLKWLHICSSGSDRKVYRRLQHRGVCVTTSAGANKEGVASMALTAMLFWSKGIPRHVRNQADRRWQPMAEADLPRRLRGQTAVVLGTGYIGSELAMYLKALGLKTVGINRRGAPADYFDEIHSHDQVGEQAGRADWLFICCPLTDLTRGLVSREVIARLPRTAGVINIARGGIVDEPALADALAGRRIAFAYLDVFATEPLSSGSAFWAMDNVLATPHIAGHMTGNSEQVGECFLDNFSRWIQGRQLNNVARTDSPA